VEAWIVRGIYQAGLANENQQRFGEARLLYRTIIEQYQDKEYRQKAQRKLQEISGK
jgi:outer membrane protein assembly factor BamD (BamD/ComL family)